METHPYRLGMSVTAAVLGFSPEEILLKKASTDTIANHRAPGYGALQRVICKYASEAYAYSGNMTKFAYHVYAQLAKATPWWPSLDPYYDAAVSAIGKVHSEIRKEAMAQYNDERFVKAAQTPLWSAVTGALNITPELLKTILAAGAAAGVGGGALTWLANRSVAEDEPKLEAMRQNIDYYNKLTEELEAQLASRKSPVSEQEVGRIVRGIV